MKKDTKTQQPNLRPWIQGYNLAIASNRKYVLSILHAYRDSPLVIAGWQQRIIDEHRIETLTLEASGETNDEH